MSRDARILGLLFAVLTVGCSAAAQPGDELGGELAPPPEGAGLQIGYTAPAPAGADLRLCRLVVVPAAFAVGRVESMASSGSHHVEIALTKLAPQDIDDAVFDCDSRLVPRRGTIYAAQETQQRLTFAQGATLALGAGEVLLVEAHLVNAATTARDIGIAVNLWAADPSGPALGAFRLAPATSAQRVICRMDRERYIQVLGGDRGMNDVTLTLLGGELPDPIPLFEGGPADPLVFRPSLRVAAGERFELSCAGGADASCALLGTYYPADEAGLASCEAAP